MGFAGIYTWLCIWFLPTKIVAMASFAISGVASLLLLYPFIVLLWSNKVLVNSREKKQPLWIVRFICPVTFLFIVWYPLYFFISLSLPSIYTVITESPSTMTLSVSKRYSTGTSKREKFWLAFYGYHGSIRVEQELYESFKLKHEHEAFASKSPLGIYVFKIN